MGIGQHSTIERTNEKRTRENDKPWRIEIYKAGGSWGGGCCGDLFCDEKRRARECKFLETMKLGHAMQLRAIRAAESAMTLAEVIVMIAAIAIFAFLSLPTYQNMNVKGARTKALSSAKQVALALRLYADDNGGNFPSFTLHDGKPTTTPVPDSNTAFAQLFPAYVQEESVFWVKNSAFCSATQPDEVQDNPPLDTPVNTLKAGENEWAYVLGLTDKSDPGLPLIASGFANPVLHTYCRDQNQKGGAWIGLYAVVIHPDMHGSFVDVDQNTMTVIGPNGPGMTGDIFTTAHTANGWLKPGNVVVNPK
jgi:Tfp pilus assembly protein PilE